MAHAHAHRSRYRAGGGKTCRVSLVGAGQGAHGAPLGESTQPGTEGKSNHRKETCAGDGAGMGTKRATAHGISASCMSLRCVVGGRGSAGALRPLGPGRGREQEGGKEGVVRSARRRGRGRKRLPHNGSRASARGARVADAACVRCACMRRGACGRRAGRRRAGRAGRHARVRRGGAVHFLTPPERPGVQAGSARGQ